jgi:hypothetical protein
MPELTIARLIPPVGQCFHGSSRGLRQPAVAARNNRTVELTKCLMEHDIALNRKSNPDVGSRNLEIASQIRTDDRVRGFSTAKGKKKNTVSWYNRRRRELLTTFGTDLRQWLYVQDDL